MNIAKEKLSRACDNPPREIWTAIVTRDARLLWVEFYRDWRRGARIMCHWNDEMVEWRGFGILARAWNGNTCVGRKRVSDMRTHDFKCAEYSDFNPDRIIS